MNGTFVPTLPGNSMITDFARFTRCGQPPADLSDHDRSGRKPLGRSALLQPSFARKRPGEVRPENRALAQPPLAIDLFDQKIGNVGARDDPTDR